MMGLIHRNYEVYNKPILIVTHDLDVAKGADYVVKWKMAEL